MADPRVKQLAYDALALSLTGPIDLFPRGTPTQSILGESAVSRNLNRSPILQNFDDGRASMTAYEPTMRERLAAGAQTGLEFLGVRRPQARAVSQGIFGGESSPIPANLGIADVVPFLGTALQTEEAVDSLGRARQLAGEGQYGRAAVETGMGILGLVPGAQATNRAADVVANRSVQAIMGDPNATARGVLEMAGDMAPLARITGYHGSPHGPISQFDFEKVGSGAGTTNFGYGTYIAEHPEIAGMFRKGRTPSSDNPDGFLYQVDIPDEIIPKMLNWYEEVPEGVRKNLSEKAAQKFGTGLTGTTGERLYKDLAFSFKMDGSKNPEKDASKWLAEQGVPGIQYENLQMVRGMGRDTNNYVLFEPEKIKIEKINEENAQDFLSARGLLEPQAGAKGFNVVQPGRNPITEAYAKRLETEFDALKQEYSALPSTNGGQILNTDNARELSPEYRADRTKSADVHEPSSELVKRIYAERLAQDTPEGKERVVLFTAGGTGAGKTTSLDAASKVNKSIQNSEIIYDTNMNTFDSSDKKVKQALDAGRDVNIIYTYRDPVEALENGALKRASRMEAELGTGRTVPINEHLKTHIGARKTMEALQKKYGDDPRFNLMIVDNSRGPGKAKVISGLDNLPKLDENTVRRDLNDALENAYKNGQISRAIYEGTRIKSNRTSNGE